MFKREQLRPLRVEDDQGQGVGSRIDDQGEAAGLEKASRRQASVFWAMAPSPSWQVTSGAASFQYHFALL